MRKTFIVIAIVSVLLAILIAGCKAATPTPAPMFTPVITPMATIPSLTTSPMTSIGGLTSTAPGLISPLPTVTVGSSAGAT